ncbi:DNA repair protein RecO [Robiginitalea sp. SC105]|uniref:DNA repair protein RecO n=1 Tax=Robiginitalea sp. SC105 TaxID=2762332 RepID=UPI001639B20A|nr:DNA repair protein RecO [Robiginitalea sp. SC105]MBC2838017.1 DNA repair protein RecO [Robiginitalea sp. SC105]
MPTATKAIVLNSLKYGDTSLIVRMYTEQAGRQAYLLKGVLGRRKGGLRAGFFQPLTQLEVVAGNSRSGKLGYLKEALIGYPYASIHSDVRKGAIALFLSEVLSESIREEEPNSELYSYLEHTLQWLDQHGQVANFHLRFLLGLTRYLGFYPDQTDPGAPYFDLAEGAFCRKPGLNPVLSGPNLESFRKILGINFDAIHEVELTQGRRRELLKSLLLYYEIHLQGFKQPRSLTVFDEVFS